MISISILLKILGGAALGYAWHKIVGCRSGACPITANPYTSIIYGGVIGFLMGAGQ